MQRYTPFGLILFDLTFDSSVCLFLNNVLPMRKQVQIVSRKVQKMAKGHYYASILALLGAFALGVSGGQGFAVGVKHASAVTLSMLVLLMVPLMLIRYFRDILDVLGDALRSLGEALRISGETIKDPKSSIKNDWSMAGIVTIGLTGVLLIVASRTDPTVISRTISQADESTRMYSFSVAGLITLVFMMNWAFAPARQARQRVRKANKRSKHSSEEVGLDGLFKAAG